MSLQACAGIFSAVVRIITTLASPDANYSALGYFLSGVFVIAICLVSFFILMNLVRGRAVSRVLEDVSSTYVCH